MTDSGKLLHNVSAGDPIRADFMNDIVRSVNRMSTVGGGTSNVISNGAGNFVRQKKKRDTFWEGRLTSNLYPAGSRVNGSTTGTANLILPATNGNLQQTTIEVTAVNWDSYAIYFEDEYVGGRIVYDEYRVEFPGRRTMYGIADQDIASGESGSVSMYDLSTNTSTNLTVFNITGTDITAFTQVEVTPDAPGSKWVGKPLSCPT